MVGENQKNEVHWRTCAARRAKEGAAFVTTIAYHTKLLILIVSAVIIGIGIHVNLPPALRSRRPSDLEPASPVLETVDAPSISCSGIGTSVTAVPVVPPSRSVAFSPVPWTTRLV
ncbi:hypothetical protein EVAR_10960_1 [Eumeta japonica]|uniref:Uncharacterized protein n=1 Tax=Eumeta variegata TaxID=151549 RepID=A0A4C1U648_EUMVA|nr:hypothetical protein EVAR_10960_1 [Eumeta japonica]